MELLSGGALAWQQYRSLLRKNVTLTWRHRRSAALQLFSSLIFIFLIFCIDRAVRSRFSYTTAYRNVPDPEPLVAPPIPPCEDKFFVKSPCYDFLWSGGGSARVGGLVDAIRRNNPGRPIPPEKVTLILMFSFFLPILASENLGIRSARLGPCGECGAHMFRVGILIFLFRKWNKRWDFVFFFT
jgi:hypothetical protein